jgi:hypothetical protein
MGRVHTIGKIVIWVYANDHLPAHFHVIHPDFEALIEIETLSIYAGELPPRFARDVIGWVRANLETVKAEWNRINSRFPV